MLFNFPFKLLGVFDKLLLIVNGLFFLNDIVCDLMLMILL